MKDRCMWMKLRNLISVGSLLILVGCGALDDSSGGGGPGHLSGLWLGDTSESGGATEAVPTVLLLHEGFAYLLRDDEAQLGNIMPGTNDQSSIDMDVFSYANPDTDNMFFVGVDNNANLMLDMLQANAEKVVITYNDGVRSGRAELLLDSAQVRNVSLNIVEGAWKTGDAQMDISTNGGFNGWNSATGCQWRGTIDALNNTLYKLEIIREECTEFNPSENIPAPGLALIDGEGDLHFIIHDQRDMLWMQFQSAAPTAVTPTDDDAAEEEEVAEEEEEAA